jgi:HEAT repeat protein
VGLVAAAVGLGAVIGAGGRAPHDLHGEIDHHLREAEWGSADPIHFARRSRGPVGVGEPVAALIGRLRSPWPEERWRGAEALAATGDRRAVAPLVAAMQDPAGTGRVCVMAKALGQLGDPRAVPPLAEAALDPTNEDLRLCAIRSLGMIGDRRAVPRLIVALESRTCPRAAATALARLGDPRATVPIRRAAADPGLRLWMVAALGELGDPEALPFLGELSGDPEAAVRAAAEAAIWKIGRLAAPDPVTALATALREESDPARRQWAAVRLGERWSGPAVAELIAALADGDRGVRGRAAAALVRVGAPAAPAVRETLTRGTPRQRRYAVAVLGYLGTAADLPRLRGVAAGSGPLAATSHSSIRLIEARLARGA